MGDRDDEARTQVSLKRIVELYDAWGKPEVAAKYRPDLLP
jgi:hypothetical protein